MLISIKQILKVLRRTLPYVVIFIIFFVVYLGPKAMSLTKPPSDAIVGLSCVVWALTFTYFDWLIRARQSEETSSELISGDLGKCLSSATTGLHSIKHVRIFALSSGYVHPALAAFFESSNMEVEQITVLLCDASSSRNFIPNTFYGFITGKQMEWLSLANQPNIGNVTIYTYDFTPAEYYVVFDSSDVVFGKFVFNVNEPSYLKVDTACHVSASSAAQAAVVRSFVSSFDGLIAAGPKMGVVHDTAEAIQARWHPPA